jgi:cation transport regulator ChaB
MPARKDLPGTLQRSPKKAQETYIKAHDSAVKEYGEGERAHRTAFAAVKHSFEKVGDRWQPKKRRGPSDARARRSGRAARRGRGESLGGVDLYGHTKDELMARARKLDVHGRSRMNKLELARAIARKQR